MDAPKLGAGTCQCATCGRYFVGTGAFDRHRNSDHKTCTDPGTLGMETREGGAWRVPLTPEQRAKLERLKNTSHRRRTADVQNHRD